MPRPPDDHRCRCARFITISPPKAGDGQSVRATSRLKLRTETTAPKSRYDPRITKAARRQGKLYRSFGQRAIVAQPPSPYSQKAPEAPGFTARCRFFVRPPITPAMSVAPSADRAFSSTGHAPARTTVPPTSASCSAPTISTAPTAPPLTPAASSTCPSPPAPVTWKAWAPTREASLAAMHRADRAPRQVFIIRIPFSVAEQKVAPAPLECATSCAKVDLHLPAHASR